MSDIDTHILIATGNPTIASKTRKMFERLYPKLSVDAAGSIQECLRVSANNAHLLVIADYRQFECNGVQLCEQIAEHRTGLPSYYMLLLNEPDHKHSVDGLEAGLDDFIHYPFLPDEFLSRIRLALHSIRLHARLAELREKAESNKEEIADSYTTLFLRESVSLFDSALEARFPGHGKQNEQLRDMVSWVCSRHGGFKTRMIDSLVQIAQVLHVGMLSSAYQPPTPLSWDTTTTNLYSAFLQGTIKLLDANKFMSPFSTTLVQVGEHVNGTGFPQRTTEPNITPAARILRATHDWVFGQHKSENILDNIRELKKQIGKLYHKRTATLVEDYLWNTVPELKKRVSTISLPQATPGMIIARDIVTSSGLKLVPSGMVLDKHAIELLFQHAREDKQIKELAIRNL